MSVLRSRLKSKSEHERKCEKLKRKDEKFSITEQNIDRNKSQA